MKKKTNLKKKLQRWKRKHTKLTSFALAASILIILTIIIGNIQVKLLFDTESVINIQPTITSKNIQNGEAVNITMRTNIDKLNVCGITCTHTLKDISTNTTTQKTHNDKENYEMTIEPPLPGYGEGQRIYNYIVSCEMTEKRLCPVKGKKYTKTAFITIDYGLNKEQEKLKQEQKEIITKYNEALAKAKATHEQLQQINEAVMKRTNNHSMPTSVTEAEEALSKARNSQETILKNYEEQRFEENQAAINEAQARLQITINVLHTANETTQETLNKYNNASVTLLDIHNKQATLTKAAALANETNNALYKTILQAHTNYRKLINNTPQAETFNEKARELKRNIDLTLQENEQTRATIEEEGKRLLNHSNNIAKELFNETLEETPCKGLQQAQQLLQAHNQQARNGTILLGKLAQDITENMTKTTNKTITYNFTEYLKTCNLTHEALFTTQPPLPLSMEEITFKVRELPTTKTTCCYKNDCKPCASENHTPIILVHGHSFSKSTSPELAFTRLNFLQRKLAEEGYINAGIIGASADITDIAPGEWGKPPAPIAISVTYYYLNTYGIGEFKVTTRKTDSIENYAIRLKETIDIVREKTGTEEVILIAHSMGGLVAREYLHLFDDEDIPLLITLGTPNHGVQGNVRKYCTLTGAEEECRDMAAGSDFLQRLNNPAAAPKNTDVYTIAATGCPTKTEDGLDNPGDGVVLAQSVALPHAKENRVVHGTCTDPLQKSLHMDFVNPAIYPETYEMVKEILEDYQ